jgi:hypothetical protein
MREVKPAAGTRARPPGLKACLSIAEAARRAALWSVDDRPTRICRIAGIARTHTHALYGIVDRYLGGRNNRSRRRV